MNIKLIKQNTLSILKTYVPNLLIYLSETEIESFIDKSLDFTNGKEVAKMNGNFLVSFFLLVREHKENKSSVIRNEFEYMNYLLGKFNEVNPNSRAFKNFLIAVIYDFRQNGFLHALGEISACLTLLDYDCKFSTYEKKITNGKSIDFEFIKKDGNPILFDVVTINFDSSKYENPKGLQSLVCKRISDKFNNKTDSLEESDKENIYIFPIFSGLTIDIIKENKMFLNNIDSDVCPSKFNCFEAHIFANLDSQYFNLFTTNEIIELDKKKAKNVRAKKRY
ncbi:hypothetical protein [Maribacter sp. 2210JD10-5]|uniref:hypothetical protein n=1 Tax=Maribacter sp. 2210JD10-5 TaxID=3386272 RepID=UPI0039BD4F9B